MATTNLVRGMGSFFKECEHPESRWPRCPHEYKIRYRNAAGKQTEESGFATQDKAKARLAEVYQTRKNNPQSQRKAERIQKYGSTRFEEYVTEWRAGQRDLSAGSLRHLDSRLEHHLYPAFRSRRMGTFDHKVVEAFIQTMERNGVALATQANVFDKLKSILLDAHRLGLYDENPLEGVKPPQYNPKRAVIPSPAQLRDIRVAGDDVFCLAADLMSGCGMRNGEVLAVNINNIVADDVYRITEQVNQTTKDYGPLKHRKVGDYRDVPLPAHVKHSIEWYADKYGTVGGYLLRHPQDLGKPMAHYYLEYRWRRIKKAGIVGIPEGMVLYGLRHFFASNCLAHNLPITDVAEWMGHRSLDITFKIYRHLMPGS
ncbi:tyrosine-type recombinase/integrase, partial [Streptomyces sp. CB01881]|uniref:tyrosine-type recombinase/integrase n=1 Tax=Streptomyces sp. CB01881 TaxID=2078691 RepID=UPI001F120AE6